MSFLSQCLRSEEPILGNSLELIVCIQYLLISSAGTKEYCHKKVRWGWNFGSLLVVFNLFKPRLTYLYYI